jgi:hypothetical protein
MKDKKKDNLDRYFDIPYYQRISYEKKMADDAKWIEESCNHLKDYYTVTDDLNRYERYDRNYRIANGKGDDVIKEYARKFNSMNTTLMDEGYDINNMVHKNWDILSPIYKSMVGEAQKRKLNVVAFDTSKYNLNYRKKKHQEYYREFLKANHFNKLQSEATQQVYLKHNITNPLDLSPEEQQEIKFEIDEAVKFKTVKDIDDFMKNDYQSPFESQIQNLIDWYIKTYKIKFLTDESFKHFLLTGKEIAYQGIKHLKPFIKMCNAKGFKYKAKPNSYFIEDGEWWIYEEFDTYSSVISELGSDKDIREKLNDLMTGSESGYRRQITGKVPNEMNRVVATINNATDGAFLEYAPQDLSSREGQAFINSLYSMLGYTNAGVDMIKRTHYCFTSFDKVYLVYRKNKNTNDLEPFWVGENYEFNEETDYSISEHWAPAYYEATTYGQSNNIFTNKKRIEYQNRDINDPFKIIAPYTGIEYSKLFDNAPSVAPIEFGLPYQYDYNIVKASIETFDRTNIGSVLGLPGSIVPHDWSLGKYTKTMMEGKIAYIDDANIDNPNLVSTLFKSVDLSNNSQIQFNINRLEHIKRDAESVMSYSPSTLGQAPASMTATNNQQNIIQSSYKTEDIFNLHNTFITNLLNSSINIIKICLQENKELRSYLLSDLGSAIMDVDFDKLMQSDAFVQVINDTENMEDLRSFKDLLHAMVQSEMVTMSEAAMIQFNKNPAAFINLAKKSERKAEERRQEELRLQQEQADKDREIQLAIAERQLAEQARQFDRTDETKRYIADKQSMQWAIAQDVDMNKIPDSVQNALIKQETELEKAKIDKEIAEKKLRNDIKLASMKTSKK